ncbi:MAG: hypothetical protein H6502_01715 [Candidatus Woesearchaeota archaeon]|nr:MAG: hypothetical protein H6502_01715 [Candidatus Woesearchaeota archaeon]
MTLDQIVADFERLEMPNFARTAKMHPDEDFWQQTLAEIESFANPSFRDIDIIGDSFDEYNERTLFFFNQELAILKGASRLQEYVAFGLEFLKVMKTFEEDVALVAVTTNQNKPFSFGRFLPMEDDHHEVLRLAGRYFSTIATILDEKPSFISEATSMFYHFLYAEYYRSLRDVLQQEADQKLIFQNSRPEGIGAYGMLAPLEFFGAKHRTDARLSYQLGLRLLKENYGSHPLFFFFYNYARTASRPDLSERVTNLISKLFLRERLLEIPEIYIALGELVGVLKGKSFEELSEEEQDRWFHFALPAFSDDQRASLYISLVKKAFSEGSTIGDVRALRHQQYLTKLFTAPILQRHPLVDERRAFELLREDLPEGGYGAVVAKHRDAERGSRELQLLARSVTETLAGRIATDLVDARETAIQFIAQQALLLKMLLPLKKTAYDGGLAHRDMKRAVAKGHLLHKDRFGRVIFSELLPDWLDGDSMVSSYLITSKPKIFSLLDEFANPVLSSLFRQMQVESSLDPVRSLSDEELCSAIDELIRVRTYRHPPPPKYYRMEAGWGKSNLLDRLGETHTADFLTRIKHRLKGSQRFDRIVFETNEDFLDDVCDLTASCLGAGCDESVAQLVFRLDPSVYLPHINLYQGDEFVGSSVKNILFEGYAAGHGRVLVLDGTVGGPESELITLQTHSLAFIGDRTPYLWHKFNYHNLLQLAHRRGVNRLLVNASHSRDQQSTQDFVRYVASQARLHEGVDFTFKEVDADGVRKFVLLRTPHEVDGFAYTHQVRKAPLPADLVAKLQNAQDPTYFYEEDREGITRPDGSVVDIAEVMPPFMRRLRDIVASRLPQTLPYSGEEYLTSFYEWERHSNPGNPMPHWNMGEGYLRAIEIDVEREMERFGMEKKKPMIHNEKLPTQAQSGEGFIVFPPEGF